MVALHFTNFTVTSWTIASWFFFRLCINKRTIFVLKQPFPKKHFPTIVIS